MCVSGVVWVPPTPRVFILSIFKYLYLFLAVLRPHCCKQATLGGTWASHCDISFREHGLLCSSSVVVAHGLGFFHDMLGIFLDQGSNLCPLH